MAAIKLTSLGITEAERVSAKTGPREAVLSFMYEVSEPVQAQEVLEATHLDDDRGQKILKKLVEERYIAEV